MATLEYDLTTNWADIAGPGVWDVQNIGANGVWIRIVGATIDPVVQGFILQSIDTLPKTVGTGETLQARAAENDARVAIDAA